MIVDATLLRLFYDPVGWADPAWLGNFGIDARWPRRLCNSLLLRRAGVRAVTRADLACAGAGWLSENWDALPVVAYLAGARLLRNGLLSGNALLRLRHGAQRFVTLPLADEPWARPGSRPGSAEDPHRDLHERVLTAGAHCLQIAWPALTPGWLDRLRLRLPPELEATPSAEPGGGLPASAGCLRLLNHAVTFHHAQNH
ncbi:hypothetical protein MyNCGM683_15420 [Achromobacter xylosoxidans]